MNIIKTKLKSDDYTTQTPILSDFNGLILKGLEYKFKHKNFIGLSLKT